MLLPILMTTARAVAVSVRSDEIKKFPLLDHSERELIPGGVVVTAIVGGDGLPGNLETTIIQTDLKTTCRLFPSI